MKSLASLLSYLPICTAFSQALLVASFFCGPSSSSSSFLTSLGRRPPSLFSPDELQTRYNKASDQLQTRIKQSKEDREQFLQDLVSRGEKVQNEAEVMLQEGRSTIEEQIEAARTRVTSIVDVEARLQAVSEKFDSLKNSLKKTA